MLEDKKSELEAVIARFTQTESELRGAQAAKEGLVEQSVGRMEQWKEAQAEKMRGVRADIEERFERMEEMVEKKKGEYKDKVKRNFGKIKSDLKLAEKQRESVVELNQERHKFWEAFLEHVQLKHGSRFVCTIPSHAEDSRAGETPEQCAEDERPEPIRDEEEPQKETTANEEGRLEVEIDLEGPRAGVVRGLVRLIRDRENLDQSEEQFNEVLYKMLGVIGTTGRGEKEERVSERECGRAWDVAESFGFERGIGPERVSKVRMREVIEGARESEERLGKVSGCNFQIESFNKRLIQMLERVNGKYCEDIRGSAREGDTESVLGTVGKIRAKSKYVLGTVPNLRKKSKSRLEEVTVMSSLEIEEEAQEERQLQVEAPREEEKKAEIRCEEKPRRPSENEEGSGDMQEEGEGEAEKGGEIERGEIEEEVTGEGVDEGERGPGEGEIKQEQTGGEDKSTPGENIDAAQDGETEQAARMEIEEQEEVQEEVHEGVGKEVQEDMQEDVQEDVQENVDENMQEEVQEMVHEDVHEDMQEDVNKEVQEDVQEVVHEDVQEDVQEDMIIEEEEQTGNEQVTEVKGVQETMEGQMPEKESEQEPVQESEEPKDGDSPVDQSPIQKNVETQDKPEDLPENMPEPEPKPEELLRTKKEEEQLMNIEYDQPESKQSEDSEQEAVRIAPIGFNMLFKEEMHQKELEESKKKDKPPAEDPAKVTVTKQASESGNVDSESEREKEHEQALNLVRKSAKSDTPERPQDEDEDNQLDDLMRISVDALDGEGDRGKPSQTGSLRPKKESFEFIMQVEHERAKKQFMHEEPDSEAREEEPPRLGKREEPHPKVSVEKNDSPEDTKRTKRV